jgi:hypothetical protein
VGADYRPPLPFSRAFGSAHVIVNPGEPTSASTGSPQKATIVRWSDNGTIFDALVQGKADLMIIDTLETGVRAKLHAQLIRTRHSTHSEFAYWKPRDPIFAAYANQWLNLLDLSWSDRRSSPDAWRVFQWTQEARRQGPRLGLDSVAVHLHGSPTCILKSNIRRMANGGPCNSGQILPAFRFN